MKTTDFITENQFIGDDAHAMHQDHEVQMARSDCYSSAKYAIELHKLLKNVSEMHGLDGWVSEKLTLANDYLRTVHEYLTHEMSHPEEAMPEMFTAESAEIQFAELLGETTGKQVDELSVHKMLKYSDAAEKDRDALNQKWDNLTASEKEKERVLRHEKGEQRAADKIKQKTGKLPVQIGKLDRLKHAITREGVAEASPRQHPKRYQSAIDAFNRFMDEPESTPKDELQSRHDQTKKRIKTNTMAGPKGQLPEAGPGDINRLEHRGEEYNVYFNQRKGMYTARGIGQMKGQIQPGWFHTLADAIDHAEMEIGGYDEHDGVAESDPLANRDAYAKQHQQGQVYKTHYPKGENPFHKAGMKDKRSTKMSAYDISNTGPKGQLPESDVAEAAQGHTIEAHGIRGMDRKAWHKTFKNVDQMNAWAEKYDAEIHGTRDLEQAKRGNLSPAMEGEKKGLYYNVNKRKAAGTSRPASNPKAPTDQAWKDAAKTAKKESVAETTSAGMATAPGVGKGPATGTLFGGSYAPKTPFTGKKKAKTSVIKR